MTTLRLLAVILSASSVVAGSMLLGSKCDNDGECHVNVSINSRCQQRRCVCQPYYAMYNATTCLDSTLLGFDCLVDEQCSLKVANSVCIEGSCGCDVGFLQFRRHTCLKPARPGEVCYSDAHCHLWDTDSHCEYMIRNLLGRCMCNYASKHGGRVCLSSHERPFMTENDDYPSTNTGYFDLTTMTPPKIIRKPIPPVKDVVVVDQTVTSKPFLSGSPIVGMSQFVPMYVAQTPTTSKTQITTKLNHFTSSMKPFYDNSLPEALPLPASPLKASQHAEPQVAENVLITSSKYPTPVRDVDIFIAQLPTLSSTKPVTEENPLEQVSVDESSDNESTSAMDATIMSSSSDHGDVMSSTMETSVVMSEYTTVMSKPRQDGYVSVSLGLACVTDIQCQTSDAGSLCVDGVCDCATRSNNSDACSAKNRGCFQGTFQCRSSGACISWFFVCDGHQDCDDGSDEECSKSDACPTESFPCGDGKCVSRAGVCDGVLDCSSGLDELHCKARRSEGCPQHAFQCSDGSCLPEYEFCNAVVACSDGSDEPRDYCRRRTRKQKSGYCPFRCGNGRCRSTAIVCSGRDGCGDASDEARCAICKCPPRDP